MPWLFEFELLKMNRLILSSAKREQQIMQERNVKPRIVWRRLSKSQNFNIQKDKTERKEMQRRGEENRTEGRQNLPTVHCRCSVIDNH